jgi:hypothetical protein
MSPQLNEEQIIRALNGLSPQGKRNALRALIGGLEELDKIIERNQEKLLAFCRERGIDFFSLSEREKENLIEKILHED